jgi:hypothetical protein
MCLSGIYTYVPPTHVSEAISLNHGSKSGTRMMIDKKSRSIALIQSLHYNISSLIV